ncbi:MAG TPA: thioesterase family protein [Anaerolineae bacterium]|nr:thioesterase family protein [Anaerolineae bacterium]
MPLTHKRTFRVRHYECDAYGHVNHANYVRYMQEAAFDASAAAGYDLARYESMGRLWLIRETEIEYLRPLRYGDVVEVETWVADFRRVRSRRAYVIRCLTPATRDAAAPEVVATGHTDWVFMDTSAGRPASIPEEMMAVFFPEGAPAAPAPREPFPDPGEPRAHAYRQRRFVEWRDLDTAGHVNNAVYFSYVEEVAVQWALTGPLGLVPLVARKHRIEYLQQAMLGDELEVVTWFTDLRRTSAVRHTEVSRVADDARLARVQTIQVWIDPATGAPAPIAGEFRRGVEA